MRPCECAARVSTHRRQRVWDNGSAYLADGLVSVLARCGRLGVDLAIR